MGPGASSGQSAAAAGACADAPPPRQHPKATRKKRTAEPGESPPQPKRGRRTEPDAGRPDSGRPRCTLAGHGGSREERACRACLVVNVNACAAAVLRPPGTPDAEWAFEVLQRLARTRSGTYWCPTCLREQLLDSPDKVAQLARLSDTVRRAEEGEEGAAGCLAEQMRRVKLRPTTKCTAPAHVAARNGGFCRCPVAPQRIWRSCGACRTARAFEYAGLD